MKVRPSAWWYAIVPIIILAGFGFGIAAGIDEGRAVAETFQELGTDGEASVDLDAGDEATLFALFGDGRGTDDLERPEATVTIEGPAGDDVPFHEAGGGRTTFDLGGDAGIDLGTFTARSTGRHRVRVEFADDAATVTPTAAVGRLDISAIVGDVLRPIGIGMAAALAAWLLILLLRGASKRRNRSASSAVTPTASGDQRGPFV